MRMEVGVAGEDNARWTCPQCQLPVTSAEAAPAWGMSEWACPEGQAIAAAVAVAR